MGVEAWGSADWSEFCCAMNGRRERRRSGTYRKCVSESLVGIVCLSTRKLEGGREDLKREILRA